MNVIARSLIAAAVGAILPLGLMAAPAQAASLTDRFYRETAAYGARDKNVNSIAHVREL